MAPGGIVGNLPDRVQVVPELVDRRGRTEEQGEKPKHSGRNSMFGPVDAFHYNLNQLGAFWAYHPLNLPDQASLRGLGAECKTGNGEHNHQAGRQRERHIVRQRRPHSRGPIGVPVSNRDAQQRHNFSEGNRAHGLYRLRQWVPAVTWPLFTMIEAARTDVCSLEHNEAALFPRGRAIAPWANFGSDGDSPVTSPVRVLCGRYPRTADTGPCPRNWSTGRHYPSPCTSCTGPIHRTHRTSPYAQSRCLIYHSWRLDRVRWIRGRHAEHSPQAHAVCRV